MSIKNDSAFFFISGNVPSSKNGKIWTGRHLIWSKAARKYVNDTKDSWALLGTAFRHITKEEEYPLRVSFKFVRKSKHKFDYVNPLQTVLDLMVTYKWIPDDNADIILPVFEPYEYNKEEPGVFIKLL